MKQLLTLLMLFTYTLVFSQQISPEVISSGGGHIENDEYMVSWTIGEVITSTIEDEYILTQGFHQDFFTITAIDEKIIDNISINIFPNPTTDFLNIELKSINNIHGDVSIQLFDATGRLLLEKSYKSSLQNIKINLLSYERSHYILRVIHGKQFKTFKIIKS